MRASDLIPMAAHADAARFRAFRADILTKDQRLMTRVAALLTKPAKDTTEVEINAAFDTAIGELSDGRLHNQR